MLIAKNKIFFGVLAIVFLLVPAALASQTASPQTKSTRSYVFSLTIGMAEKMWTPAQVRTMHPKTGEVMVMGSMAGGMSMGGAERHVEVHIKSRATGKVVVSAQPTINAVDTSVAKAMPIKVPVMAMQGVVTGASDLHYGNNIKLVAGHTYKITVALKGERVIFHAKAPKA